MSPLRPALVAALVAGVLGCTQTSPSSPPATSAKAPANALTVRISYGSEKKAWLLLAPSTALWLYSPEIPR